MSTVQEIEEAIEQLPADDVTKIASWLMKRDNDEWDRQMDQDSASGKLDALFGQADAERTAGVARDWPANRK